MFCRLRDERKDLKGRLEALEVRLQDVERRQAFEREQERRYLMGEKSSLLRRLRILDRFRVKEEVVNQDNV